MGIKTVYIFNRTTARAEALAAEMNQNQNQNQNQDKNQDQDQDQDKNQDQDQDQDPNQAGTEFKILASLEAVSGLDRLDAVMGTVPGAAALSLPLDVLEKHTPVVMDAAYQSSASGSRLTALLQDGKKHG